MQLQSMDWVPFAFGGLLTLGCILASYDDVAHRRIANWLCMALFIAGLGYCAYAQPPGEVILRLFTSLILIGIGAFLNWLGWIGAGDAKLIAAISVWFPLRDLPLLLGITGLAGLGLAIIWFILRMLRGKPIKPNSKSPFDMLPYGVAISAGAMMTFWANH